MATLPLSLQVAFYSGAAAVVEKIAPFQQLLGSPIEGAVVVIDQIQSTGELPGLYVAHGGKWLLAIPYSYISKYVISGSSCAVYVDVTQDYSLPLDVQLFENGKEASGNTVPKGNNIYAYLAYSISLEDLAYTKIVFNNDNVYLTEEQLTNNVLILTGSLNELKTLVFPETSGNFTIINQVVGNDIDVNTTKNVWTDNPRIHTGDVVSITLNDSPQGSSAVEFVGPAKASRVDGLRVIEYNGNYDNWTTTDYGIQVLTGTITSDQSLFFSPPVPGKVLLVNNIKSNGHPIHVTAGNTSVLLYEGEACDVVVIADKQNATVYKAGSISPATTSQLGGVIVSDGLSVDTSGKLKADVESVAGRTGKIVLDVTDVKNAATLNQVAGCKVITFNSDDQNADTSYSILLLTGKLETGDQSLTFPGGVSGVVRIINKIDSNGHSIHIRTPGQQVLIDEDDVVDLVLTYDGTNTIPYLMGKSKKYPQIGDEYVIQLNWSKGQVSNTNGIADPMSWGAKGPGCIAICPYDLYIPKDFAGSVFNVVINQPAWAHTTKYTLSCVSPNFPPYLFGPGTPIGSMVSTSPANYAPVYTKTCDPIKIAAGSTLMVTCEPISGPEGAFFFWAAIRTTIVGIPALS